MADPKKETILIADDTPENIQVLMETLKDDYALIAATNGAKTLDLAARKMPDLILLDVMMPEMDGYEVCARLKADAATRGIPVIFVTAKSDPDDEMRGLALGAVDYITKPYSPPVVRARVRTHLEIKRAREELRRQNEILLENAQLREDVERMTRHDLKTPLNGIIAIPQLLLMELGDGLREDLKDMLRSLERDGYRMLHMINLSLDLYKMETGAYVPRPEPVDVMAVVANIVRETAALAEIKALSVRASIDGAPAAPGASFMVLGEELLCYSMLANIIKNAMEAAPQGGVITVALAGGPPAAVAVHNMGAVPLDMRGTFFDKYATSGKASGTGLGTYSASLIARTLGGGIAMETSEAHGTTVTITLPV
ncbi:MAG: response regulator [Desulfovibrionaceae bacterium]